MWSVPAHDFDELELRTLLPLRRLVDASDGALVISTRVKNLSDGLGGARPARTVSPWSGSERERVTRDWLRSEDWTNDPVVALVTRDAGRVRTIPQCDSAPVPGWDRSAARRLNRALGSGSRIIAVRPITENVEVHFIVDRPLGEKPFSATERETFAAAVDGLRVPACRIARNYGLLPGTRPFTPRERDVLALLLTPKSEKEIAAELGLGRRAAHHHVTSIYRKLGVTSRAGLMSQWLGPFADPG